MQCTLLLEHLQLAHRRDSQTAAPIIDTSGRSPIVTLEQLHLVQLISAFFKFQLRWS